mmetsp:Transcript_15345/g.30154  ORF Transcript_15345/g.30154 Transcript_15345/m.30154 type:complete len:877 (+) Transcript_15345:39-2669(+)|eukprot:CAMPEP_0175138198 /NCGR_PEP_ID=MMETSP0087-20121206/10215_1 /TAXON_ID=136419 /ORGANISM="Unknown Unknown, Strain D1" /LENGTH=876 /DNA_ID=CAMNT_0016421073 /DNA_START=38 /DNA_END=2671 /DNA_ORIENTATION=-
MSEVQSHPDYRKIFPVWVSKRLRQKTQYMLVLNFEDCTINIHKVNKGKEYRKTYKFSQCVRLSSVAKSDKLEMTFSSIPVYSRTYAFGSSEERELFCNMVRAGIAVGSKAMDRWQMFELEDGKLPPTKFKLLSEAETALLFPQGKADHRAIDFFEFILAVRDEAAEENNNNGNEGQLFVDQATFKFRHYQGEISFQTKNHTARIDCHRANSRGVFHLTNYRVVYHDYKHQNCSVNLPLGFISRALTSEGSTVILHCKDCRTFTFRFDANQQWVEFVVQHLNRTAFPADQSLLFAYSNEIVLGEEDTCNGWSLLDLKQEYERSIKLSSDPKLRLINNDFANDCLSPTYPRYFVVPALISDDELKDVCHFRSRARVPAVVWKHPVTQATITRCAQPMPGLKGKRNEADEKLVSQLRAINPSNSELLYFIDCRPYKAAVGNTIMGKGFENTAHYDKCKLIFMNIDNIHAIRGSFEKLSELCRLGEGQGVSVEDSAKFKTKDKDKDKQKEKQWLEALEGTKWLHYVRLLLLAAGKLVGMIENEKASVIVHCSDGWDRTSQLTSLACLLMDPYYRTLEGFAILIEKEWLAFGHKFAERFGHGSSAYGDAQRAPIFTQWLDSIYQLTRQFPLAFEFNERFLLEVMDQVLSCRFGTFLYNSDKERHEADVKSRTVSLWTWMLRKKHRLRYTNASWSPHLCTTTLLPNATAKCIIFWEGYFCRYDPDVSHQSLQVHAVNHRRRLDYRDKYLALQKAIVDAGLDLGALEQAAAEQDQQQKQEQLEIDEVDPENHSDDELHVNITQQDSELLSDEDEESKVDEREESALYDKHDKPPLSPKKPLATSVAIIPGPPLDPPPADEQQVEDTPSSQDEQLEACTIQEEF